MHQRVRNLVKMTRCEALFRHLHFIKINAFSGSINLCKILEDFISVLKYFKYGGRLFKGGAYLTSIHILGGAYSKGALIQRRALNRAFTVTNLVIFNNRLTLKSFFDIKKFALKCKE